MYLTAGLSWGSSQERAMQLAGLCLAFFSFSFIEAQSTPGGEGCCFKKVVSGTTNGMDGTFYYKKSFEGTPDPNCADGCIYTREGREGEEYCFMAVSSGAADINDECEAPSSSPTPPQGTGQSSESPSILPSATSSEAPMSSPPQSSVSSNMPPQGSSSSPQPSETSMGSSPQASVSSSMSKLLSPKNVAFALS